MGLLYKRHKLLKFLYDRFDKDKKAPDFEISKHLNLKDYSELRLVKSQLELDKEVVRVFNAKVVKNETGTTEYEGLLITDNGISAYANKKYIKLIWEEVFKWIFRRIIPLVSFIILCYKFIMLDIEEILKPTTQQQKVESLESTIEDNTNQYFLSTQDTSLAQDSAK